MHQMHAEPLIELSRSVVDSPEGPINVKCRVGFDASMHLNGDDHREGDRSGDISNVVRLRTEVVFNESGKICPCLCRP